jgi:multimeric flavodoxin WrbA
LGDVRQEWRMKALVLQGSPNRKGNTATLAGRLAEGFASRAGASAVSEYWLNDLDISPCQGCFACSGTWRCKIDDDMQQLYPELESADVIVFAVPIYWWHINAQMKLCIDRLTALLSPDDKLPALAGKRIVLVVAYNHRHCAECTIGMFEEFETWIGAKLDVLEHCAQEGHVSSDSSKLRSAYELGVDLAGTGPQSA